MNYDKETLTKNDDHINDRKNKAFFHNFIAKLKVAPGSEDFGLSYPWLIVFIGCFVQFFVLGTMNNIGSILIKWEHEFQASTSSTAFIGSLNYGLMFILGPIVTKLCEVLGGKWVTCIGALLSAFGIFITSFVTNIWFAYFTYGVMFGIGGSMCYFPSIIVLPQFFSKKLSIVNGIVSAGSGTGTMVMSKFLPFLYEKYGWRNSFMMISVFMVLVSMVSLLYKEKKVPKLTCKRMKFKYVNDEADKPFFDFSVLKNVGYCLFVSSCCLFMLGYFVPFVHLVNFSMMNNVEYSQASLLVGFMSISSVCGRLIFGYFADSPRINRLLVFQLALLMIGLANVFVMMAKSLTFFIIYAVWFGFFEGCYVCLCAVIVGDVVGIDLAGSGIGILFGLKATPLMIGPPFAGYIKDVSNSFHIPFLISGILSGLASILMFLVAFTVPSTVKASYRCSKTRKSMTLLSKDEQIHALPQVVTSDTSNSNSISSNGIDIPNITVIEEDDENYSKANNKKLENKGLLSVAGDLDNKMVQSRSMNLTLFNPLGGGGHVRSTTTTSLKSLTTLTTGFDLPKKVSFEDLKGLQFQMIPSILPKSVRKAQSSDLNV